MLEKQVCVEETYAKNNNLKIGDEIVVNITYADGSEYSNKYYITGIVSDTPDYSSINYMYVSLTDDKYDDRYLYLLIDPYHYPDDEINEIMDYVYENYGVDGLKKTEINESKLDVYMDKMNSKDMHIAIRAVILFVAVTMTIELDDKKDALPLKLSGGQQQRVAIARALANRPQIILADEPTGNLDAENGRIVLKLLLEGVRKYKQTLVLVTHDMDIAKQADCIITIPFA